MEIKVPTVSDIHSVATLLDDLQEAVGRHKPDILACVGDIIDFEAKGDASSIGMRNEDRQYASGSNSFRAGQS